MTPPTDTEARFRRQAGRHARAGLWRPDDPTIVEDVAPDEAVVPGGAVARRGAAVPERRWQRPPVAGAAAARSAQAAPRARSTAPVGAHPRSTTPARARVPAPARRPAPAVGTMPAGRVLVVIVAALVLAALVNADDLVARAERKPLGPERDRSLAVWHPIQDVSHVLQLYRLRQVADRLAGDDGGAAGNPAAADAASGDAEAAAGRGTPPAALPPREIQLRTPTPADPLRLWVGGDSMSQTFGESLVRMADETGVIEGRVHAEISSGLTRPDYYDWPRALAADVADQRSEVVVPLFGANDAQGILLPDGTPVPDMADPRWGVEYGRRVGAVMDQLYREGRLVVWILQPPMRDADFDARIDVINGIYSQQAASRPWVVVVDATHALGDEAGRFAELLPDGSGGLADARQDDGVHLTRAGADRLAADVLSVVMARSESR